jgi:hypothetical protein
MSTTFRSLAELLEAVEATKKRLEIIESTANYLKTLGTDELEAAVNMMVGASEMIKHPKTPAQLVWLGKYMKGSFAIKANTQPLRRRI